MKTTLYLTVALLSIAVLIQSHYARKTSDLTRRAWEQTDRAIKVAEDWRAVTTNLQAALTGWMVVSKGWENTATNCMAKLDELVTAVERRQ